MKISVIGMGAVGIATAKLMSKLGHDVETSDKIKKGYQERPGNRKDIYFVCTPEEAVQDSIEWLIQFALTTRSIGLIVARSTVPPRTCRTLIKKYGRHICHNPEFLREAVAVQDEFDPFRIVIGECCKRHGDLLESIYRPLQRPIIRTDPTTSELVKLASNAHLACLISYWNSIDEIAKRVGVSGHEVGMIASTDPRISPYGARFHQKYSGRCLPKDIKGLIKVAERMGYDPLLLKAIEKVNEQIS